MLRLQKFKVCQQCNTSIFKEAIHEVYILASAFFLLTIIFMIKDFSMNQ